MTIDRHRVKLGIGLLVLAAFLVVGFFVTLPYPPNGTDTAAVAMPPNAAHWFGTDLVGRDVFSRVGAAATRDLPLALQGTALSLIIGVPFGLLVSSKSPWSNRAMRLLDGFQTFPLLILAIAIVTLTGNQLGNVVFAIAVINVPRFIRLVRGEALALRESRFIEAAVATGCSPIRVMFRHLLPNVSGIVIAQSSLAAAQAIIVIASLNFIGVGVAPPDATWGSMLQGGVRNVFQGDWWMAGFPALAIVLVVFAFNLVADSSEALFRRDRS